MGGLIPLKQLNGRGMFVSLILYTALIIWVNQQFLLKPIINSKVSGVRHQSKRSRELENKTSRSSELYEIMAKQYGNPARTNLKSNFKKILYWNDGSKKSSFQIDIGIGKNALKNAGCPVWQCETSLDPNNISQYDAILFHPSKWNGQNTPKKRWPHQRYIFMEWNSPTWPTNGVNFFKFFNWTMTPRWDSDIVHPFGWIEPINASLIVPLHADAEYFRRLRSENNKTLQTHFVELGQRTKMAAWFSPTSCNLLEVTTSTKAMVNKLVEHGVEIDIYGGCGNLTCGRPTSHKTKTEESEESCRQKASEHYKFYFVFENSQCQDYVTEKFYAAMNYSIIPIVMDVHNNYAKVAPPHSFINVMDYPSIEELSNYLKLLAQNETLYNEYFWWKPHFSIRIQSLTEGFHYKTLCSLCAALHDPVKHANKQTKLHRDLIQWWKLDSHCKSVKIDESIIDSSISKHAFYKGLN